MSTNLKRISELPIGSQVKFGRYSPTGVDYKNDIIWNVVAKNHDGYPLNSVTLFSKYIFDSKQFDANEGDYEPNLNSRYSVSNISSWLNSSSKSGGWYKQMHEHDVQPEYSVECGFLHYFTKEEINSIRLTDIDTWLYEYYSGNSSTLKKAKERVAQKVFLPSVSEIGIEIIEPEGTVWE